MVRKMEEWASRHTWLLPLAAGSVEANGASFSTTANAALFSLLGYTYGKRLVPRGCARVRWTGRMGTQGGPMRPPLPTRARPPAPAHTHTSHRRLGQHLQNPNHQEPVRGRLLRQILYAGRRTIPYAAVNAPGCAMSRARRCSLFRALSELQHNIMHSSHPFPSFLPRPSMAMHLPFCPTCLHPCPSLHALASSRILANCFPSVVLTLDRV